MISIVLLNSLMIIIPEIELDLFLPSLSLAFEYQGIQHYQDFFYFGTNARNLEEKDHNKRAACEQANITLIAVPYWWDDKRFANII